MRISHFYSWRDLPPERVDAVLDEFVGAGIEFLTLPACWLEDMLRRPGLAAERQQALSIRHLRVLDAHSPYGAKWDLNIVNERENMLAGQIRLLDLLAGHKIETYTLHIGAARENGEKMVLESLTRLLPYAAIRKITLAVENAPHAGAGVDDLINIVRYFDSEFLGVCFDSGHANLAGDPVIQCERLLPYIVTCHLHDNFGMTDDHNLTGHGNIDWNALIPMLRQARKLQSIQNECAVLAHNLSLKTCRDTFDTLFG